MLSEAAGSLYLSLVDAVTGFNQVENSPRARQVLAVITRSGQFRMFYPGANRRVRLMRTWLPYVDDWTTRSGRMVGNMALADEEADERVRAAVTRMGEEEQFQAMQEALEAWVRSCRLGAGPAWEAEAQGGGEGWN